MARITPVAWPGGAVAAGRRLAGVLSALHARVARDSAMHELKPSRVALDRAWQAVLSSDEGHLPLPLRGALWREFGPAADVHPCTTTAELSPGHSQRLRLLALLHTSVMEPIWREEVTTWEAEFLAREGPLCEPSDAPPAVVSSALSPSTRTEEVAHRSGRYGTFRQYLYELWDRAPRATLCIEFAAGVLSARLRDLEVLADDYEDGNDRWKPDVYACWAYAGSTHLHAQQRGEEVSINRRREFWGWYIFVAIPSAASLAPLEDRPLVIRPWPSVSGSST